MHYPYRPRLRHASRERSAGALPTCVLWTRRPIGVVELGLFGGGKIPIAHNVELRRDLVDDGTPLALEVEPGGRPAAKLDTVSGRRSQHLQPSAPPGLPIHTASLPSRGYCTMAKRCHSCMRLGQLSHSVCARLSCRDKTRRSNLDGDEAKA